MDLLRSTLAYFLQGIRDCFYGLYGIYKVDANVPHSNQPAVRREKGVLAQRRAAAAAAAGVEVEVLKPKSPDR